ncbi:hypothetical protein BQ8794_240252 [Mesorhizobium prunaredense]|uniref:Uncharacterized protein n=1 Tax=Mesorhizobium prunaredense TaxID=1631249 RepID=A0A1R3V823_9HYPH|nr:hypothetical protein [Mesorhizobium prunaredense]SIT56045.1 hypothetical protein BQ8794_240252 [Mesorhizobium prunaredense]
MPSGAKLLERARGILNEIRITKAEGTAVSEEVTIGILSEAARMLSGSIISLGYAGVFLSADAASVNPDLWPAEWRKRMAADQHCA